MDHLGARFDLPLTGVYAGGDLNAISVDDESMEALRVTLGWQTTSNFGMEIGYQRTPGAGTVTPPRGQITGYGEAIRRLPHYRHREST